MAGPMLASHGPGRAGSGLEPRGHPGPGGRAAARPAGRTTTGRAANAARPAGMAARAQELRAEIASLDGVLIALQPGRDDAMRTVAGNRKTEAQAELERLEKKAPAHVTLASSFLEASSIFTALSRKGRKG